MDHSSVYNSRIIPADAGSTSSPENSSSRCWDHPRGCGEHPQARPVPPVRLGSSPRMRGALVDFGKKTGNIRIIPADAGSTSNASKTFGLSKDHPRGCGEHLAENDRGRTY